MARLNTYPNDTNVSGADKVIGTDANTGGTKNFTLSSVGNWMNEAGALKVLGQSNYVFQGNSALPRRIATISMEDYSNNVPFSNVTRLIFSQHPAGGHDVVPYLNAIIGKKIIIGNLAYLDNFAIYTLYSVEEFEPGFYAVELGFVEGEGTLVDEEAYGFAPWALEPIDALLDLQDVTSVGNTTTNSISTGGLEVNTDTLYVGAGSDRVGIGVSSPAAKLDVDGELKLRDNAYHNTVIRQDDDGLANHTEGNNNISIGYWNHYNLTTGARNISFGYWAGIDFTTGTDNIAIGSFAGNNLTTGSHNIYLGDYTDASGGAPTNEIVIGYNANGLGSNTAIIGNSNISKTVLRGNVGIGTTAPEYLLDVNTNNIRVGVHTFGHGGSDVATNLAIGQYALDSHSGSSGSAVAIGPGALQYSTNASYSTAIGEAAGAKDNGTQSTFIGAYTGPYYYELTGGYNTMVGSQAGIQMSGAASINTGIGNGALFNLSTGNNNTALGQSAGSGITTGSGNIMIGIGNNGISTGSNNVIIGKFTGLDAGLSNNVIIGDGEGNKRIAFNDLGELQIPDLAEGYLKSDVDGNITVQAIDTEDTLDSVTTRGNVTGNTIEVGGLTADTDTLHVDPTTGSVGIGTTVPTAKLHVDGDVLSSGNLTISNSAPAIYLTDSNNNPDFKIQNLNGAFNIQDESNFQSRLYIGTNFNVGIGTMNPDSKLHVSSTLPIITISNSDTSIEDGQVIGQVDFKSFDASTNMTAVFGSIRTEAQGTLDNGINDGGKMVFSTFKQPTSLVDQMVIDADGNVGIGTTSPSAALQANVPGNTVAFRATRNNGLDGDLEITFGSALTGYNSKVSGHRWFENSTERMRLISGDLGIGTTNPIAKLDVYGDIAVGGAPIINKTGNVLTIGDISASDLIGFIELNAAGGSTILHLDDSGHVGIGTTNPVYELEVAGDIFINDSSDPTLYMRRNDGTPVSAIMLDTATDDIIIGATNMDELIFMDNSGEAMRLDGSGNVGIGTTTPYAKLHAFGQTMVTGDAYNPAYSSRTGLVVDSSNVTSEAGAYGSAIEFTKLGDLTNKKAAIVPTQQVADGDSIGLAFFTAGSLVTSDPNAEVMRLTYDKKLGLGTRTPISKFEVDGPAMSQLRMITEGGPSSSGDTSGNVGDLAYDPNYLYIRTSSGWGRVALDFAF